MKTLLAILCVLAIAAPSSACPPALLADYNAVMGYGVGYGGGYGEVLDMGPIYAPPAVTYSAPLYSYSTAFVPSYSYGLSSFYGSAFYGNRFFRRGFGASVLVNPGVNVRVRSGGFFRRGRTVIRVR